MTGDTLRIMLRNIFEILAGLLVLTFMWVFSTVDGFQKVLIKITEPLDEPDWWTQE